MVILRWRSKQKRPTNAIYTVCFVKVLRSIQSLVYCQSRWKLKFRLKLGNLIYWIYMKIKTKTMLSLTEDEQQAAGLKINSLQFWFFNRQPPAKQAEMSWLRHNSNRKYSPRMFSHSFITSDFISSQFIHSTDFIDWLNVGEGGVEWYLRVIWDILGKISEETERTGDE